MIEKRKLLLLFLMTFAAFASAQTQHLFPKAEWDKASVILMHTPGEELFNGVIHPSAGLFENYFDVEEAANEHRNYIELLRHNGIKVYTVTDILGKMSIDTLRALAEKTLIYDVNDMNPKDTSACGQVYKQSVLRQMTRKDLIRCLLLLYIIR